MSFIKSNSIICADVFEGLLLIPSNSVHLIVTSSPYNVGISYDNYSDNLPYLDYLEWMRKVWLECYRVLVSGGRICINIASTVNLEKDILPEHFHPLHVEFTNQLRNIGYIYRGEFIWRKQNVFGKKTSWGSYTGCSCPHILLNCEYIIVASKDSLKLEGDPQKCDLTPEEFEKWVRCDWEFPPETSTNVKGHPVSFPPELPKRLIKLYSYVGNTVLDPFNGIGTTTLMAASLGRSYIGIDNSEAYCQIARERLNKADIFNLKYSFVPAPELVRQRKKNKLRSSNMLEKSQCATSKKN